MMPPLNRKVLDLARETGITTVTLRTWRHQARAEGKVVPGDGKQADQWSSQDKFRVVLESASLNAAELAEYCRRKGLYVEQIKAAETKESPVVKAETPDEVLCVCIGEVCTTMEHVTRIYNRTLVAVFKENRKVLKEMVQSSDKLFEEARDRKYGIMPTLRRLQQCDIDTGHFYVQVVDYLSEVTKALIHITRPAYEHINNNHEGLTKEQIVDLMRVNDQVEAIFDKINDMLRTKDFSDLDMVLEMRDKLFDTIVEAIKSQLRRINDVPSGSTRAGVLYLTILNETKTMMLQSRNLLKSQQYFLEAKK